MSTSTLSIKRIAPLAEPLIPKLHRPLFSGAIIVATDIVALAAILKISFANAPLPLSNQEPAMQATALIPIFLVLYYVCDLYPGICGSPVDELRRVCLANSSACLFISVLLLLHGLTRLECACIASSFAASMAVPLLRRGVRGLGSQFEWWGYPVALFGSSHAALSLLHKLKTQSFMGLRPVVLVTDRIFDREVDGVRVCSSEHLDSICSSGVKHALVAAPELSHAEFADTLEKSQYAFPNVIVIPDSHVVWRIGAYTRDLMGTLGLQVRNNLLGPEARVAKRAIDLVLCAVLSPIVLTVLAVIGFLVALESGFPVFYSQERVGRGADRFRIWKFRTMVRNAAEVLEQTLSKNEELRKEWNKNQKLRNDPRITAIGRLLRKTSLDELPQFWNVIRGEMSLVGPRPIVESEIAKYKQAYGVYTKTTPGVTGLWQVSGRNHTTYAERIAYDTFYVRNWSVWMDLYLLARTFIVVLTGAGAY